MHRHQVEGLRGALQRKADALAGHAGIRQGRGSEGEATRFCRKKIGDCLMFDNYPLIVADNLFHLSIADKHVGRRRGWQATPTSRNKSGAKRRALCRPEALRRSPSMGRSPIFRIIAERKTRSEIRSYTNSGLAQARASLARASSSARAAASPLSHSCIQMVT